MMKRLLIAGLLMVLGLVGCRQAEPLSSEDIQIEVSVDELAVGDAELIVNVTDPEGNPIEDATINVRGDMDMAGMTPVIRDVEESDNGTFTVPFEWTMGGDWFVDVTVTLPDETQATERFEYSVESEGEMAEIDMDDDDMAGMAMSGTSAAYMQLTNNSDADITLTSVEVALAGATELHETVVENDIARMIEQESGIMIPAGETVLLQPGGFHVMLLNLEGDFVDGETTEIILTFDNDETTTLEASVQAFAPEDSDAIESGDLVIEAVWVRPTSMMTMDDMDMEATDEAMGDMDMEATDEATEESSE